MRKGKPGNIVQQSKTEKGQFLDWHNGSKGGGRGTMGKFPAKTMTDKTLSPAAQAVLDAAYALPLNKGQPSIAAALRTAASQVIPDDPFAAPLWTERDEIRAAFFAIADELGVVK
jgi:hypothetical protein